MFGPSRYFKTRLLVLFSVQGTCVKMIWKTDFLSVIWIPDFSGIQIHTVKLNFLRLKINFLAPLKEYPMVQYNNILRVTIWNRTSLSSNGHNCYWVGPIFEWQSENWTINVSFMVENVRYSNGPPNQAIRPFENETKKYTKIWMFGFWFFGIQMVTVYYTTLVLIRLLFLLRQNRRINPRAFRIWW